MNLANVCLFDSESSAFLETYASGLQMIEPSTTITFKSDPIPIDLDVYSPDSTGLDGSTPLVVFYHFGGLFVGNKQAQPLPRWLLKACRQRGWTMILPDYRLLPESSFAEILEDVKDLWSL